MDIKKRLIVSIVAMGIVMLVGVAGYHLMEGWNLFDSLYMTIITLATVGYGETHELSQVGRIFTIFLIIGGIGILTYFFSTLTAFIVEGDLGETLRRKRMEKKIDSLSLHIILCGGGRTGGYIMAELQKTQTPFVVIDQDPFKVSTFIQNGILALAGDASDDNILKQAGITRAKGLISCLPTDQTNLFVIISAKELNPSIRIISKSVEQGVREKFIRSGADGVVSPKFIGGLRMASEMIRPTVVTFLDKMLRQSDGTLRVAEVTVGPKCHGKTVRDSILTHRFDIVLLAIRPDGKCDYVFNPKPDHPLKEKDVLLFMGEQGELQKLETAVN